MAYSVRTPFAEGEPTSWGAFVFAGVQVKVLLVTAEIDSAYKAACGSAPPEQPDYSTFSKPEKKSGCSVS
jgi:hypothetical protein